MTGHAGAERVWVLADPRAGTAAQALGIAERLGVPFRVVPLAWGRWARVPWPWPTLTGLTRAARAVIGPPWPGLVISAGRRAAPVARWLRARGARTVHCMRPGFGAADFDLLVLGTHDRPAPGGNRLLIQGACHRISPTRLAAARTEWAELAALPSPRVAVLVGGSVRGDTFTGADAARLIARVIARYPAAGLMVSTSRRTGTAATAAIGTALTGRPHRLFAWGDAGPNPLAGYLAWAEVVVVTGDSVSMLSEAAGTEAAMLVATNVGGRQQRVVEGLYRAGRAVPLRHARHARPGAMLDETGRVAAAIVARGWVAGVGAGCVAERDRVNDPSSA